VIYDEPGWTARAARILRGLREPMTRYPTAFGRLLCALDFAVAAPQEVALVGTWDAPDTAALLDVVRLRFRPNTVVALREPGVRENIQPALLRGRNLVDGRATAYVCQHYACQHPVTVPDELAAQLGD
jgi:uncharacterized protein